MKNTSTISRKIIAGMMAVMTSFSVLAVTASADSSEAYAIPLTEITAQQAETVFKLDGTRYTSVTKDVLNKQMKNQYFDKAEMMRFVDNIRKTGKSIAEYLKENGVQTLIHYPIPPHKQECYKVWNDHTYPVTEKIHEQELSIPMNQVVTTEQAREVVRLLNSFK